MIRDFKVGRSSDSYGDASRIPAAVIPPSCGGEAMSSTDALARLSGEGETPDHSWGTPSYYYDDDGVTGLKKGPGLLRWMFAKQVQAIDTPDQLARLQDGAHVLINNVRVNNIDYAHSPSFGYIFSMQFFCTFQGHSVEFDHCLGMLDSLESKFENWPSRLNAMVGGSRCFVGTREEGRFTLINIYPNQYKK